VKDDDAIEDRVSACSSTLQTIHGAFSPRHPWLAIRLKHAMRFIALRKRFTLYPSASMARHSPEARNAFHRIA
jgi:hypothetical protein